MKQRRLLILIATILIISNTAIATQDGFFEFEADCTIEIVGEPKIHEPFEAIFTFTPRQEIVHTSGILDTAKFNMNEYIKFVKGDSLWIGLLENGKTYTLRAWFVIDRPDFYSVQGVVITNGATGIYSHKDGTPDQGARAKSIVTSIPIKFGEIKEQYIYAKKYDPTRGEDVIIDSTPVSQFRDIGPAPVIAKSPNDIKPRKKNRRLVPSKNANYIYLDSTNLANRTAIKVIMGKQNILKFDSSLMEIGISKKNNNFYLIKLEEYEYGIFPKENDTLLNIQYGDSLYQLDIEFSPTH